MPLQEDSENQVFPVHSRRPCRQEPTGGQGAGSGKGVYQATGFRVWNLGFKTKDSYKVL